MRTVDVTREFYEKCNELAKETKIPELKFRLTRLANQYRRNLDELEREPHDELKRIDTDFLDLIPDAPQKRQTAGSVLSQSRSTNTLQGDIRTVYEGFGRPQGLAVDTDGSLLVAEALAGASGIYRLRPGQGEWDGEPELVVSGPALVGVAVHPAGGYVVATADAIYRCS